MSDRILSLNDKGSIMDSKEFKNLKDQPTFRTEILAGYGFNRNEHGVSWLDEMVIKPQHNKIVVGGLAYILETVFGAEPSIKIRNLNEQFNIGMGTVQSVAEKSKVCLFNIGIEGCGSSYADIKSVPDQQNIVTNTMIPFRVVDPGTSVMDASRTDGGPYWFKTTNTTQVGGSEVTKDWYYLKQFEINPATGKSDITLVHRWKDAEVGQDGTLVTDYPEQSSRTEGIESYVELVMRISAADLREYFKTYQDSSQARFNSIGLCAGTKAIYADGTTEYSDVRQITVLNFSNEMLHFEKDMSVIYRIYLS